MLTTTNPKLTEFLQLEKGPNLIYGQAGTGKTCLSLMFAIEHAKKGKVIFIDTEGGFSTDRIAQLEPNYQQYLKNIFFIRAKNFKQQHKIIQNLEQMKNIQLIVIDTIGNFFRTLVRNHKDLAQACLKNQLSILTQQTKQNTPILITTQVYTDIKARRIEPIGGYILKSFCPTILRLDQDKNQRVPKRIITIEKPKLKTINFEINTNGINLL